jgi:Stage II sporulation protein E (SpoIIE)
MAQLGAAAIINPKGAVASAIYEHAARSTSLVTTRQVSHGVQRLGYLVSAKGLGGTFVVSAGQQLPVDAHVTLPSSSPDAQLDIALYYGKSTRPTDLIETNAPSLPLQGTFSTVTEPFGTGWLTLVAAPRSPLTGGWQQNLPWAILAAGLLLTAVAAVIAEWLGRRRTFAEAAAGRSRQMYRQQRDIAETLQGALLPKALPPLPGVDIAARYMPATQGVDVGGDWYSVVPVSPDQFIFCVGDVSGHGVSAASTMAPLRFTLRGLAKLGMSPAEILGRLEDEIDIAEGHFATVLVGRVDLSASTVSFASAGHLPPLLVSPAGSEYLDLPTGPPLGVHTHAYEEKTFAFADWSVLVVFTDGLVERRDISIADQMTRLATVASDAEGASSAVVADRLFGLPDVAHEDDAALLVIRRPSHDDEPGSVRSGTR